MRRVAAYNVLPFLLLCWVLCSYSSVVQAQEGPIYWYKKLGDDLFSSQEYARALQSYRKYQTTYPNDHATLLNMGICSYYVNLLDDARRFINQVLLFENQESVDPRAFLYLGKVAHAELQFKDAAEYYKIFLKKNTADTALRFSVKKDLLHCATGMRTTQQEDLSYAESLGQAVNTIYDEYGSVSSPNYDNRIYFSTNRPDLDLLKRPLPVSNDSLQLDIFYTQTLDGKWYPALPIYTDINTPWSEQLLGFNEQGKQLYYQQYKTPEFAPVFVDTFQRESIPKTSNTALDLPAPLMTAHCDFRFFNDSLLLFASQQLEGYGGYDLYWTERRQGQWSIPKNLGEDINSAWDERFPFLAKDGKTLYFSTNDPRRSVGGFDIFRAVFNPINLRWLSPENMGLLINSAGDDTHFHLTKDTYRSFFTSTRRKGVGGQDLYAAYFAKARPEMLLDSLSQPFTAFLNGEAPKVKQSLRTRSFWPVVHIPIQETGTVIHPQNDSLLSRLLSTYQQRTDWRILLSSATSYPMSERLEQLKILARWLQEQGVPKENIYTKVVWLKTNTPVLSAYFYPSPTPKLLEMPPPLLIAEQLQSVWQGLTYRVQVKQIQVFNILDSRKFPLQILEYMPNGTTNYTLGIYRTLTSARQFQTELERLGVSQVSVGEYWQGIPVLPAERTFLEKK